MLCDELKAYVAGFDGILHKNQRHGDVYLKDDVDAAIAELKARIQLDDDEMAGFLQLEEECGGGDLRNYIAELKAKLEEKDKEIAYWREEYDKETKLTDALNAEIESLKASHYAEMVDAGMENRRLKRALYKVCDNWAVCEMDYWRKCLDHYEDYFNVRTDEDLTEEKCERMIDNWRKVAHNCRAKAEEYK